MPDSASVKYTLVALLVGAGVHLDDPKLLAFLVLAGRLAVVAIIAWAVMRQIERRVQWSRALNISAFAYVGLVMSAPVPHEVTDPGRVWAVWVIACVLTFAVRALDRYAPGRETAGTNAHGQGR